MTDFHVLSAVVYAVVGIALFCISLAAIDKVTHFWKEIAENRNMAMAVLIGAMSIGLCLIISAAVH